ncbi:CdaR family protein [Thermosediminibacter oceani]|uniref:YbbR family protein n=1 Tax=Thermosediminibacter oceani (strain ATCC BAA-1034 / DSM 16646 / JW/IW-1228P) TaxID=555079 RepID=D9RZR3_THEOJ|nr:CdaR family protein [Thermosediminibacter oceani]ADL08690.1 YbbR family protein [Thermosediminibacter oceani DSM 16646]
MGRFFSSDMVLKVISVLVALVMWMYVMNEQNPQVTYVVRDVPVQLKNLDDSKLALKDPTQQYFVNVKVRARRSIIADLKPENIVAEANLRGRMEGENMLPISVYVPANVELLDFSPKEIMVTLEAVIEEQLPVYVDVKGVPAEGFAAKTPGASPQAVLVRGPRTLVNSLKKAVVEVDVTGKNGVVTATLPVRVVDAKDNELRGVTFRPDTVEVTVPIVPVSTVTVKPDVRGQPLEGFAVRDVRVEPSVVIITGSSGTLRDIREIPTKPVNISGLDKSVAVDTELQMPGGVMPFDENMNKVRVVVDIEKVTSGVLSFTSSDINFRNLGEGLKAVPEEGEFMLTVRGPESIIEKVDKNIVKIYADASGLGEGEYYLRIKAEAPEPYRIVRIEPENVRVTIQRL